MANCSKQIVACIILLACASWQVSTIAGKSGEDRASPSSGPATSASKPALPSTGLARASRPIPGVRPGKGFGFIPGDFVEYSNTEYINGKPHPLPSTIMVALGGEGKFERVLLLMVKDEKVVARRIQSYDMTQEKVEQGDIVSSGRESLTLDGVEYDCTWEKRRLEGVTGTFWRSTQLPFEKLGKVEMDAGDGRKTITEIINTGPDTQDEEKNARFTNRLKKLLESASQ